MSQSKATEARRGGGFKWEGAGRAEDSSNEVMGSFVRRTWARFTIKQSWARSILEDAENVRRFRNGRQETAHKEELDLLQHSNDLRFEGVPTCQACNLGKSGDWGNHLDKFLGENATLR